MIVFSLLFRLLRWPFMLFGKLLISLMDRMEQEPAWQFLINRYGIETAGTIIESVVYYGHGMHDGDPCLKGRYRFLNRRGKAHVFSFSRFCFDLWDYPDAPEAWQEMQAMFEAGSVFRLRYIPRLPHLHNADFHLPPITRMNGQMIHLVKNRAAFVNILFRMRGRTSRPLNECLSALEQADGDVERAVQALTDENL